MVEHFKPVHLVDTDLSDRSVDPGSLLVTTDTKHMYFEYKDENNNDVRIKISDIIMDTYSNITSPLHFPLTDKIYLATDTHQLLQATYDTSGPIWNELGGYDESGLDDIIYESGAVVSISLNTRKIYYLTNNNITSISLTAASNLSYCTLCFTAGTSTSFSPPTGARCIGHDCYGGVFTPAAGREYQIAVDVLNNVITFYVLAITLNTGLIPTDSALNSTSTNPISNSAVASAVDTLNGSITNLNSIKSDVSSVVTNSDTSVSLTLDNNTIYRCTASEVSSLTISGVSNGFKYATITFTSPVSTPTTFAVPATGYYCSGVECIDGVFTPVTEMRYNLSIENEGDRIAIYVMEAL